MQTSSRFPGWRVWFVAALGPAAAAGARYMLSPWVGNEAPFLLFAISTLLVAVFGGFWPGFVATVIGALAGTFLFLEPHYSFDISRGADVLRLVLFLILGAFISRLCAGTRENRRWALATARRAAELDAQARAEAIALETTSAELRDTRTDFLAVFDYAAVGMAQADPASGRMTRVNQKFCEMMGFTEEELESKRLADLAHPDDREFEQSALRLAIERGTTEYAAEKRYIRKDGAPIWTYFSARVVRSSTGKARMILAVVIDITERKRAEHELQDRESQLRQIGDNLPEGFLYQLVATPDGHRRFLFFSAGVERITGVPAAEALADSGVLYSLLHPEDLPRVAAEEAECVRSKKPFETVARSMHRGTGEWRWTQIRSAPRSLPNGDILWDGVFLDITSAKHTEEALAYSMERLKLAQRAGRIGVFDWQVNTGDVIWNDEEQRIFGIVPGTFSGRIEEWAERVHPDDLPRMRREMQEAMDRQLPEMQFSFRIIRPDGALRWIEGSGRFFYDQTGKPLRMVGVNIDETERRETQARIEENETHLQSIVDAATASGVGIVRADLAGRIREANDAFFRIVGLERQELDGAPVAWLAVPASGENASDATGPGPSVSFERSCTRKDGVRVPMLLTGHGAAGSKDEFLWFILDLSEQKKAEAEMRVAKEAAEGANRAKDHFLATLSHELRTPLAPVVPLVDHLMRHPGLPQDAIDDLAVVRRNIALETRLIDDLLDLTRVEKGKLELRSEHIDLQALLKRTLAICSPEAEGKRISVDLELKAEDWGVWGDPVRVQQVFWNLLNNAFKFSDVGGTVVLRATTPEPGRIRVEVQDHGRGISEDLAPRLFTPFEQGERRSDEERRGLGLGLAITKALVEAHRGRIAVHSAGIGKGAVFQVDFPTSANAAPLPRRTVEPRRNGHSRAGAAKRILLVEDHIDTGVVMERLLKSSGYVVQRVTTKTGAIEAGKSNRFDVVVSDIGLPDGSGHEVMRALGEDKRLRGIALSGFGTEADVQRSREAGFLEHLVKPVNFDELLEVIAKHCPDA